MNRMQLTAKEREQLENQLEQTQDAKLYRRLLAVLKVDKAGRCRKWLVSWM